jgi:hypothetical protein
VKDVFGMYPDSIAESGIHGTPLRAAIAAAALKPEHEVVAHWMIETIAEQWGLKGASPVEAARSRLDRTMLDAEYGNCLQMASFSGQKGTVSLLLRYGADPNVLDTSYRTSLHIAAWSGFHQIVDLLLDKNLPKRADATIEDEWGATALVQAEESLDREGPLGAGTEVNLQSVIQLLRHEMGIKDSEKTGAQFYGPKRSATIAGKETKAASEVLLAKPVFSLPFWVPGVGFRANIIDFWDAGDQECMLLKRPWVEEILFRKGVLDGIMKGPGKSERSENKLRWIHLPINNVSIISSLFSSSEDHY